MEPRAHAATPRLLILAAEPKWLAADVVQAAERKSLLLHAIHVPVLETVARLVADCSESVAQAAVPKSLLAILVQETTALLLAQAAALKPTLADRPQFAEPLFWMASKVSSASCTQLLLTLRLASTALLLTCTRAWLLSMLLRQLQAAVAKPLLQAAALKLLADAVLVLAAALKSLDAEKASWAVAHLAALK